MTGISTGHNYQLINSFRRDQPHMVRNMIKYFILRRLLYNLYNNNYCEEGVSSRLWIISFLLCQVLLNLCS